MERTLSSEERIRRAEEIYQRRKMQGGVRVSTSNVNSKKQPEYQLFKKLALQIAICLLIYFIFYLIQNSNYIFSENVINKTREFLSYDINFQNMFNQIGDYYNEHIAGLFGNKNEAEENSENQNIEGETAAENTVNENVSSENVLTENAGNENAITDNTNGENLQNENANSESAINENSNTQENSAGIGGGEEGENLLTNEVVNEITKEASADEEQTQPLTQMEIDANEIKANYSLIVPLKGVISSRFGPRTATSIVSANHAGIDIAANEGTVFIAAMEGKVTYISPDRRLWKSCLY